MEINVSQIKNELNKLNIQIQQYENNYLNYYNVMKDVTTNWKDGYSKIFTININKEKLLEKNTIDELKKLKDIYNYLIDKYGSMGNKYEFNLKNTNKLLNQFDNCLNLINTNINLFNNLDFGSWNEVATYLRHERNKLYNIKTNTKNIRNILNNKLISIEEYEKSIKLKLTKFSIEKAKETDESYFNKELSTQEMNTGKSFINEENLKSCIDKILLYSNEEAIIFSKILSCIENINSYYNTNNKEKLTIIYDELLDKFNVIKRNKNNNIEILNRNISKYKDATDYVENLFNNIKTNI